MTAGYVGLVLLALGIALIIAGTWMSIVDWNDKRRAQQAAGTHAEAVVVAEVISGLAKLFDALRDYPTGRFLIAIGLCLVVLSAIVSTTGALVG
jgi:uncharacterized membrane protein